MRLIKMNNKAKTAVISIWIVVFYIIHYYFEINKYVSYWKGA